MSEPPVVAKPSSRKGIPHKRPRKPLSCLPCRLAKLRCDRQQPCSTCCRRQCDADCTFKSTAKATPIVENSNIRACDPHPARNQSSLGGGRAPPDADDPAHAVPLHVMLQRPNASHGECTSQPGLAPFSSFAFGPDISIDELLAWLPSRTTREYLISRYFTYQSPLFHVLHGPTFQREYADFAQDPSQVSLPWLALLFMICSSSVYTLDAWDPVLVDGLSSTSRYPPIDPIVWPGRLRSAALTCLSQSRFMVCYNLHTLQALLIFIYGVCHSEGVDHGWTFLGVALNIGIALRCNINSPNLNCIEKERRRRCWAGILLLHTYQGILFRDIDMSFLLNIPAAMPTDANDVDILEDRIQEPLTRPTGMSLMVFKLRLFELSTRICAETHNNLSFDESARDSYDILIAKQQQDWDSLFLPNGTPLLLDTASYAHWCILQTYAHQLYLLIHRPFYHSRSDHFSALSRSRYLGSSVALLDLHRQIYELPTLRPYRWLLNGMTSFNALQGAVALATCLMDEPESEATMAAKIEIFTAAVGRIESLQPTSALCAKAYPALRSLQTQLSCLTEAVHDHSFQEGVDDVSWSMADWIYWDNVIWEIGQ